MRKFGLALSIVLLLCLMGSPTLLSRGVPFYESCYSPLLEEDIFIPAHLAGGLIVIRAQLNGVAGNYILDTGASELFINEDFLSGQTVEAFGLNSSVAVEKGTVDRFTIGGEIFKNQPFYKMNMRHLEELKGCRIAGIIGINLLKKFTLFVDYQSGIVRLEKYHTPEKNRVTPLRNYQLNWQGHFPTLTVIVNKVTYDFAIDTGAEANIFSGNFKNDLAEYTRDVRPAKVWTIADATSSTQHFTLTEMECLGLNYTSLGFMFSDLASLNKIYSVKLDGILGYPFLRRHPFTLNFPEEQLTIWE